MSIMSLTRSPHLLVFRDASIRLRKPISPSEMGSLLHEWLEWHDLLESQGRMRFRSPVESESQPVSSRIGAQVGLLSAEQKEPVVGYLLIDAVSLEEATEIARGCPGLERGFIVEVYRPFEGNGRCRLSKVAR
jgi:hypothetical protein